MASDQARIARLARETFGYERLRPGQETAIQAVLDRQDTLVVLPTGSGKSAIYQLAGLLLPGPTIVISPLLALQRDQVQALEEQDAGGAAEVNSTVPAAEREEAFDDLAAHDREFLFLTPEQLASEVVLDRLRAARPSLFVVDEAHCISEWGHDFRPEYLKLGAAIAALGHPVVLALTATAAPPVRQEILDRLGMREPRTIVRGFDRPNIRLAVERYESEDDKRRALLDHVADAAKPGIVYAATRKHAEMIAGALCERGVRAVAYHAGMKTSEREKAQQAFMDDKLDAIVATTAFGMGIDKPNVRFVFHYEISDSVDSYYQEIGRAGRDGEAAQAILFYRPEDLGLRRFFAGGGQVEQAQVEQVAVAVRAHDGPVALRELREETDLSPSKLTTALSRLEEAGAVAFLPTGEVVEGERQGDLRVAAAEATTAQEQHKQFEQSRIAMMQGYAETRDCRRGYLLNYFGEEFSGPCGRCDNCDAGATSAENPAAEPFPLNSRVRHSAWGEGLVLRYEGDKLVVLFDDIGYKTLAADVVTAEGLLEPA